MHRGTVRELVKMNLRQFGLIAALFVIAGGHGQTQRPGPAASTVFSWQTATPESQSMSRTRLDALKDELARRKTRAFLVIRHDKIVYEWYADGVSADNKQGTASLAKAAVGGLSLGVALTDGKVGINDKVTQFCP